MGGGDSRCGIGKGPGIRSLYQGICDICALYRGAAYALCPVGSLFHNGMSCGILQGHCQGAVIRYNHMLVLSRSCFLL